MWLWPILSVADIVVFHDDDLPVHGERSLCQCHHIIKHVASHNFLEEEGANDFFVRQRTNLWAADYVASIS